MEQKKHNQKYRVGIVTLSDKGFKGEREDLSGPKIKSLLPTEKYEVISYCILPDDQKAIEKELCRLADEEQCALARTLQVRRIRYDDMNRNIKP